MSDFIDDGLLKDFFDEAFTQVDVMEKNLLTLEKKPDKKEAIDELFRAAHTLKGGSATVHMEEITEVTHVLEDVMEEVRSGNVKLNAKSVDVLLTTLDIIKAMVNERSKGKKYKTSYSKNTKALMNLIKKDDKEKEQSKRKNSEDNKDKDLEKELLGKEEFKVSEYELLELNEANPDNLPLYKIIVSLNEANPMRTVGGIQIFTSLREVSLVLKTVPEFDEIYSDKFNKDVMYIVATKESPDKLKDYATIPDTTDIIIVTPVEKEEIKSINGTKKEKNKTEDEKEIEESDNVDEINLEIESAEKEEGKTPDHDEEEEEEYQDKKPIRIKEQRMSPTSILKVDSARIDNLLNMVQEITINKATFNQVGSQFLENYENFNFSLIEYKDSLKQFFEKVVQLIHDSGTTENLRDIKKDLQNDVSNIQGHFDSFVSQYKSTVTRLRSTNQNLDRISSSLQEGVMRVRMVPVKQIFSRFPRMVRDLSRSLNKNIELIIKGEDTEIDKAMIDDLIDPLIHIVRNSLDHGIESPEEREKLGKKSQGTLELNAFSEGNIINIYVTDDGKGIDTEKVRKKAIENHLIPSDSNLKDQDVFNLIFEPGFSTAEEVTAVSGRGVGLDVVKKNLEKLNGTIRVASDQGQGTTFTLKLPLTLAIIQGLMVDVYGEIYAIPISSVNESIRIKPDEIKSIDNYEVINVRDDVLSLLRLNRLFKLGEDQERDYYFVIIVGTGTKKIGLLVDSVIGEEDIVIKPLRDKYTNTPGIAGATIMGDGTVSLILDVSQLIELGLKIEEEEQQTIKERQKGKKK